jgi:glycosyltransferase involved in cell wall biosynthesis
MDGDDPPVRYVHEPQPGISAARNRALDEAASARVLVFIDDDERPRAGWLTAMVSTFESTQAAAVQGVVIPQFERHPDAFMREGGFFIRARRTTGTELPVAATNNLLLDMERVRHWNLRFPTEFGLTGGEDTVFTRQIRRRGGRIVFCDEAVLDDLVPADRMTRQFVLDKAFRFGNVEARADLFLADGALERLRLRLVHLVGGTARCAAGTARRLVGTATGRARWEARGAWTAARGQGMLDAVVGNRHEAYGGGAKT